MNIIDKTIIQMDRFIIQKVLDGERLTLEDGISLFSLPLLTLGWLANYKKEKIIPGPYVTFVVDRVISYTNICNVCCKFCAFYRPLNHKDSYLMSDDEIFKKIKELVSLGGTQVLFQGGVNPNLNLEYYTRIFREIKSRFPVHLHSLSPVEIDYISKKENISISETIDALKKAGLDSIPGGGAEILVDRPRKIISPSKITSLRWLEIMETAHNLGMLTTATMMYGSVETLEERIQHLLVLRDLQDCTKGFTAFIPWSFSPQNTQLPHIEPASGIDYLKIIAAARLILDNFSHIQSGWLTEGHRLAQVALSFGADDMGGILIEDKVLAATGIHVNSSIQRMIHCIKGSGKIPVQRNTRYEQVNIFNS